MKLWTLWSLRRWEMKTHNMWRLTWARPNCKSRSTTLSRLLLPSKCQNASEWISPKSSKCPGSTIIRTEVQVPLPISSPSLMTITNLTPHSSFIRRLIQVREVSLTTPESVLTMNLPHITQSTRTKPSHLKSSSLPLSITQAIFSMMSVSFYPPMCLPNRS